MSTWMPRRSITAKMVVSGVSTCRNRYQRLAARSWWYRWTMTGPSRVRSSQIASSGDKAALYRQTRTTGPHRQLPQGTRLPSTGRQERQALTDSFLRGQGCPLQADKNNRPSQTASSGDKAALYRQTRTTGPHRQLPQGTRLPSTGRQEQQALTDSFLRGQGCPLQADKNNRSSQTASSGDKAALYRQTRTTGPHR